MSYPTSQRYSNSELLATWKMAGNRKAKYLATIGYRDHRFPMYFTNLKSLWFAINTKSTTKLDDTQQPKMIQEYVQQAWELKTDKLIYQLGLPGINRATLVTLQNQHVDMLHIDVLPIFSEEDEKLFAKEEKKRLASEKKAERDIKKRRRDSIRITKQLEAAAKKHKDNEARYADYVKLAMCTEGEILPFTLFVASDIEVDSEAVKKIFQ